MTDSPTIESRSVSNDEMEIAYAGPALLANKFYVSINPAGVRIAFAELHPQLNSPVFRTAVLLPFPDALALLQITSELIEKNVKMDFQIAPDADDPATAAKPAP